MRSHKHVIIITLIVVALTLAPVIGSTEASHENIPQDLPWYFIAVFGDNRPPDVYAVEYPEVYYKIISEIGVSNPFAVIGTGDHTGKGLKSQIDEFLNSLDDLQNVYVIMGNHDLNPETMSYWYEHVSKGMYYVDAIPGWRVILVDYYHTEVLRSDVLNFIENSSKTERSKILVVHTPIEPWLDHNMPEPMRTQLRDLITEKNFKLVLQGHWHGYADVSVNGTRYLVIAGGGAPLYEHENGLGKYCYAFLVLWPNGSYEVLPIDPIAGHVKISENNTSIKIENTKLSVYGTPTEFPLRVKVGNLYVVLLAPHGVSYVNFTGENITVSGNVRLWYSYEASKEPTETPSVTPEVPSEHEALGYKELALILAAVVVLIAFIEVLTRLRRRT